jgi:rhodanese-related sulfurtransferase
MKNIFFVIALILCISCKGQEEAHGTQVIDIQTLKTEVIGKDVQLVDVRSEREYNQGHIDDAININIANKDNFKKEIQKLDKTKPVYIYCQAGVRSHRASKIMQELGFTTIYDFTGGWGVWSNQ